MADILPIDTNLEYAVEYTPVSQMFSPMLGESETLVSINITIWDNNDGIRVLGNSYAGEYANTFDISNQRLLYRLGDTFSNFESWEDISHPQTTDVYLWRAPTESRFYNYTVEMVYQVTSEGGEGSEGSSTTVTETLTKTYRQEVKPNWDSYSKKLRDQISIRRKTWLD